MSPAEIYALVDRLRRQFPRHPDVLEITDFCVNMLAGRITAPNVNMANTRRDRRDYMRAYMREYRAKEKAIHPNA